MYTYISETYIVVVFSLFPNHFLVGFCLKNRTKRTYKKFLVRSMIFTLSASKLRTSLVLRKSFLREIKSLTPNFSLLVSVYSSNFFWVNT